MLCWPCYSLYSFGIKWLNWKWYEMCSFQNIGIAKTYSLLRKETVCRAWARSYQDMAAGNYKTQMTFVISDAFKKSTWFGVIGLHPTSREELNPMCTLKFALVS